MADLSYERDTQTNHNAHLIAGLDEAGRGALAGPVVAGAVILPLADKKRLAALSSVNDSKKLTAKKRDAFYDLIIANALCWGVGIVSAKEIDKNGIIYSTKAAMKIALTEMTQSPDFLLIDGRIRLTSLATPQQSIIRGDSKSLSIAAASILAKVTRDRIMIANDETFPAYGFARHKGYGTKAHIAAIENRNPCPIHRYSFAPIRKELV